MKQSIFLVLCSVSILSFTTSCKKNDSPQREARATVSSQITSPASSSVPEKSNKLSAGTVPGGQRVNNLQEFDPYPALYILTSILLSLLFARSIKFQKQTPRHF